MQFGRISNFGLLEMTRQRLRESSVRWNMILALDSFALKIVKKSEELAFSNKAKIVNISVPLKVKTYIEENLSKTLNHFKKNYKLEFNILADENLIVPEYKINLLNKNKKTIKKIENIEKYEDSFIKQNYDRKKTEKNNFISNNKFKKKFKYNPRARRGNFRQNKKEAS